MNRIKPSKLLKELKTIKEVDFAEENEMFFFSSEEEMDLSPPLEIYQS